MRPGAEGRSARSVVDDNGASRHRGRVVDLDAGYFSDKLERGGGEW